MHASDCIAVLLVLAAAFSYLNRRFLRLPTTVGLTALTLLASLVAAGLVFPAVEHRAAGFARQIDFNQAVLHGMLGFLLFAEALHIDLDDLARQKGTIALLTTVLVQGLTIGPLNRRWLAGAAWPGGEKAHAAGVSSEAGNS